MQVSQLPHKLTPKNGKSHKCRILAAEAYYDSALNRDKLVLHFEHYKLHISDDTPVSNGRARHIFTTHKDLQSLVNRHFTGIQIANVTNKDNTTLVRIEITTEEGTVDITTHIRHDGLLGNYAIKCEYESSNEHEEARARDR